MAQHIYRPTEPYYDPTEAMDSALDEGRPDSANDPVVYLDWLLARNDIGKDERDAGAIMCDMAAKARITGGSPHKMFAYLTRRPDGVWGKERAVRSAIEAKVKEALAAVRVERRRRELDRLICRTELCDTTAQLSFALEDVANHFWPVAKTTHQRNGITLAGNGPALPRLMQSPLDILRVRGVVDETQHAAGQRYYSDWYHSGLSGIGGIDYSGVTSRGAGSAPHMMPLTGLMAVKRADHRKARALLTDGERRIVETVVLEERGLAEAGREATGRGRKADALRRGGDLLRSALDRLARHYGFVAGARAS